MLPRLFQTGICTIQASMIAAMAACDQSPSSTDAAAAPPAIQRTSAALSNSRTQPWFEEIAAPSGLRFQHDSGHRGPKLFPEIACGGAALFDMDSDGDLDAYLIQAGPLFQDTADPRRGNQLFRNRGDGTFEDVTQTSGAGIRAYGMGVAVGDYDNDGDNDLFITNFGPDVLLQNDGRGHFTDVTTSAGVGDPNWGASAGFVDYDRDGDLDLYFVNYIHWSLEQEKTCYNLAGVPDYCGPNSYKAPLRSTLYRNNGDGTFDDVSAASGLGAAFGNGLGIGFADFNADAWPDLFVANDGMPNQLWINQGDGTFRDRAWEMGCAVDESGAAKAGMGVAIADLDDDLDMDLLVVNLLREGDSLLRNEGSLFVDATRRSGLLTLTRQFTRFGVGFRDFNNDGLLDLYQANGKVRRQDDLVHDPRDVFAEPNLLARGLGDGRFDEVKPRGGTEPILIATSRAAAFGDVDNDGRVDILIANRDGPAHLLRNIVPNAGHWIMFRVLDEHARDALGATITLKLGERTIMRDVQSAGSYCAASDPRVHVGLGAAAEARNVAVRWIDGSEESFGDHRAGQIVTLRRGGGQKTAIPAARGARARWSMCRQTCLGSSSTGGASDSIVLEPRR